MKEKTVEDHLVSEMEKAFPGLEQRKFEIQRNDPDRIFFLPGGRAVLVETKRPKKTLRPGQQRAINRFLKLGFEAYWADTKEKVDLLIERLKLGAGL